MAAPPQRERLTMKNVSLYVRELLFTMAVLSVSCSCDFPLTSTGRGEPVPTIQTDIVIQQQGVYQGPICNFILENNYLFLHSTNHVQKYDLVDKRVLWSKYENDIFPHPDTDVNIGITDLIDDTFLYKTAVEYSNREYKNGYIIMINKNDGTVNKRIRLLDKKYPNDFKLTKYNNYLFFGYNMLNDQLRDGFGYIDLTKLEKDTESGEPNAYTANVHIIREIPAYCSALMGVRSFPGDQYGYVVWYEYEDKVAPGDETMPRHGIAAIDLANAQIAWEDTSFSAAIGSKIRLITDKYLFAMEYDPERRIGRTAVLNKQTGVRVTNLDYVWSAGKDYIWDQENQRVYLTTEASVECNPLVAAIYCLDAETGNIIWSRYRDRSEPQIGMQPQVRNGVLYVPTSRYLELYDANTGKPLGRDPRVRGDGENFGDSAVWNDIILFHDGANTLYGVKMNWKIVNGQLVKE